MKNIYLHVGRPKTGTTALQHYFYDNRDVLLKHDFLYPDFGLLYSAHHKLAGILIDETPGIPPNPWGLSFKHDSENIYGRLKNEIDNSSTGNILISSEGFRSEIIARKKNLFKNYNVKVIIYLRRQDELAISSYNQTIKNGEWQGPAEDYMEQFCRRFDYSIYLDKWAELFGLENIITRIYESNQFIGGNIFSDFMACIGLTVTDEYSVPEEYINTSIDRDKLELKRLLNKYKLPDEINNTVNAVLPLIKTKNPDKNSNLYCVISPKQRREILFSYEQSNSEVARTYFNRDNGQLFYDSLTEDENYIEYPGLSAERFLNYFSCIYKYDAEGFIKMQEKIANVVLSESESNIRYREKDSFYICRVIKNIYSSLRYKCSLIRHNNNN